MNVRTAYGIIEPNLRLSTPAERKLVRETLYKLAQAAYLKGQKARPLPGRKG